MSPLRRPGSPLHRHRFGRDTAGQGRQAGRRLRHEYPTGLASAGAERISERAPVACAPDGQGRGARPRSRVPHPAHSRPRTGRTRTATTGRRARRTRVAGGPGWHCPSLPAPVTCVDSFAAAGAAVSTSSSRPPPDVAASRHLPACVDAEALHNRYTDLHCGYSESSCSRPSATAPVGTKKRVEMADVHRLPPPVTDVWDWQMRGSCRGLSSDLFFHPDWERGPARAIREARAKNVCRGCPVLAQCRAHALTVHEPYGIWGGLTEGERKQIEPTLPRPARPTICRSAPMSRIPSCSVWTSLPPGPVFARTAQRRPPGRRHDHSAAPSPTHATTSAHAAASTGRHGAQVPSPTGHGKAFGYRPVPHRQSGVGPADLPGIGPADLPRVRAEWSGWMSTVQRWPFPGRSATSCGRWRSLTRARRSGVGHLVRRGAPCRWSTLPPRFRP